MSRSPDDDSIQAAKKQIQEHDMAVVGFELASNPLPDISTLIPPEALEDIFHWSVILGQGYFCTDTAPYSSSSSYTIGWL